MFTRDSAKHSKAKACSRLNPIFSIIPFFPCGSLQLSCRQAPQGDHLESRHWCWQGMEQWWTAKGGSSPAHSLAFTGLDTEQTKEHGFSRQWWSVCLCVCDNYQVMCGITCWMLWRDLRRWRSLTVTKLKSNRCICSSDYEDRNVFI